ncbi:histidine kinase-, DNA gyrase B-, and HSP90-like ATPase family protein [Desulfosporosinus sp. OT]|nr:histidine kinase-, DNA gyrase B-, and HSP90-like ATPase family protein [Desulfosporosinus sp. OT]
MEAVSRFNLGEIVDIDVLQEIQVKFSEATGLAAVIVDAGGNPITKPSNFTKICTYIRSFPQGLFKCVGCDNRAGRMAMEKQKPFVYLCHSGLTDLAAPIIVQNQYIGAFLAGQVVLAKEDYDAKAEMIRRLSGLGMETEVLAELFDVIEVVPEKRLKAAADLIYIMSNYIVEIGVVNIVQQQLVEELKAKADLEATLHVTELKALQAQVNPHFLFNTLNTIARLALLEGAGKTQEIVYALSDLVRENLRDIDVPRTLEEEVKSAKDYLTIQKVRFGDRIQSFIDIDPKIMRIMIPALTLQPLIENAIIHGLEKKVEGGQIYISGRIEGEEIVISVRDTGVGVQMEHIQSIFSAGKRTKTHGHTTGLGIINVHKRIQHHFGPKYGLEMESEVGEGTSSHIRLPYSQS